MDQSYKPVTTLWVIFLKHTLSSVIEKGNEGRWNGENQKGLGKQLIPKLAVFSEIDLVMRNI